MSLNYKSKINQALQIKASMQNQISLLEQILNGTNVDLYFDLSDLIDHANNSIEFLFDSVVTHLTKKAESKYDSSWK